MVSTKARNDKRQKKKTGATFADGSRNQINALDVNIAKNWLELKNSISFKDIFPKPPQTWVI